MVTNSDVVIKKKLRKNLGFIIEKQIDYQSVVSKDQKITGIVFL